MIVDRRKYFRTYLANPVDAKARLFSIGGEPINVEKFIEVSITDLSTVGIRLETPINLSLEPEIILELHFTLGEEPFRLFSKLVRKNEVGSKIEYGVQFTYIPRKDLQRLLNCLNQYQIKNAKVVKIY